MIDKVSGKNKWKQEKRIVYLKKNWIGKKKKQNGTKYRIQRRRESNPVHLLLQAIPWPRTAPRSATNSLDEKNFVISKPFIFVCHRRCLKLVELYSIINSNIHLRKISLSTYFKVNSHYFGLNGPIDVDNPSRLAWMNLVANKEINRGPYSKGLIWSWVFLTRERIDEI